MQGVITYEVISLLAAFGLGVCGVIVALYRVRDELKDEIKSSRHLLRGEIQREVSETDGEFTVIERRLSDIEQRLARIEAKVINGKHG